MIFYSILSMSLSSWLYNKETHILTSKDEINTNELDSSDICESFLYAKMIHKFFFSISNEGKKNLGKQLYIHLFNP